MSWRTDAAGGGWTLALAATLAAAAVLRLLGLNTGLWYDEIVTLVESARLPIAEITTRFTDVNTHPLYSVMAHLSLSVLGESAWALRLPAAIFGVASVVMVYRLSADMLSRAEAWVATAVIATSYHHVWFSQNARGYTVMGFFALVTTHALLRISRTGRGRDYVIYGLAAAAGIYTHLTMGFVVAGQAVVVLAGYVLRWEPARRQPLAPILWTWTGAAVLSIAAYAPFIPGIIALMGRDNTQQAASVATASWAIGEAVRSLLAGSGIPAALVGGLLAAFGSVSVLRRWPFAFALLVAPAVVTGATLVLLGQPLRPRFFFFLAGAAAIFVGRGIGAAADMMMTRAGTVSRRGAERAVVVGGALLVLMSLVPLRANYRIPKQDFGGAVALLEASEDAGMGIGMAGPACLPFEIYYNKRWSCLATESALDEMLSRGQRVRVVFTLSDYIMDAGLKDRLLSDCAVVREFPATLGGGAITVCEFAPDRPEPDVPS